MMLSISSNEFRDFYRALWDRDPFPWQERVATHTATGGRWPAGIALPTGSGKTSCLEIALFSLVCQAARLPSERTAPRRIFFVIDRRVVVDEAHEHAVRIARALLSSHDDILVRVAENLKELSLSDVPLTVHRMRGGTLRDMVWARNPAQAAIILSTVDQIGSRMFFRGYGVSRRMAPIHAALTANDSLVLLDEAHCARPFASALSAIERYRTWGERPISLPFQHVVLSATLPSDLQSDSEGLSADDREHAVLGPRLRASKPARIQIAKNARGENSRDRLAEALADEGRSMIARGRKTVAIMVNRVHTARLIRDRLRDAPELDVLMMTGRMRSLDRDAVLRDWKSAINVLETGRLPARPLLLVATQCLEVGANLSFDGLVTECASLDALRQRFGRLNRFPERASSCSCEAVIMIEPASAKDSDDDPIYGASLARTWKWLESIAVDEVVDFGIDAMGEHVAEHGDSIATLFAPAEDPPSLLPAYLDFWVQTSPRPAPDPDPAVFLHGVEHASASVEICWRVDLARENVKHWVEIVSMIPPTPGEMLEVPLWIARSWMSARPSATNDLSDLEIAPPDNVERSSRSLPQMLRWQGSRESSVLSSPSDIRPGDVLVLPAAESLSFRLLEIEDRWGGLGHFHVRSDGLPRVDLAESSFAEARDLPVLRVTEGAVSMWGSDISDRLNQFFKVHDEITDRDTDNLLEILRAIVDEVQDDRVKAVLRALLDTWKTVAIHPHPAGGVVLKGRRRLSTQALPPVEDVQVDGDEFDTSRSTTTLPLDVHLRDVERRSLDLAIACGLPRELAETIALSGRLHDIGKADVRFQLMLHRGDEWAAAGAELLAKSPDVPLFGQVARRIQREIGLPDGFRHELVSVRLAEASEVLMRLAGDSTELMLHLVASHHGYCRPFAPVVLDQSPVEVAFNLDQVELRASSATGLERVDSGVTTRFWRLVRRYGWWGLAFLEAIMRLADHLESERRERQPTLAADHDSETVAS